jgi:hypothetical protein
MNARKRLYSIVDRLHLDVKAENASNVSFEQMDENFAHKIYIEIYMVISTVQLHNRTTTKSNLYNHSLTMQQAREACNRNFFCSIQRGAASSTQK